MSKPAPYQEVVPIELQELWSPLELTTVPTTPPPFTCAATANTLPLPIDPRLQVLFPAIFVTSLQFSPLSVVHEIEILCDAEVVFKKVTLLEVRPEQ